MTQRRAPYLYGDDERIAIPTPIHRRATRQQDEELPATGTTGRATSSRTTPRTPYQQRRSVQPVTNTDDDERLAPITRLDPRRTTGPVQQQPRHRSQRSPWPLYMGVGMLIMLILIGIVCLIGTIGASFWVTHITDPATYGPARGQVTSGVFGGGDSQAQPSKVVSMNSAGKVMVIVIHANDPSKAQMFPGPDLAQVGFPDPSGANVEVRVGDFDNDGHMDIKVTIVATVFYTPFQCYSRDYFLVGDGQGNFKQRDML